MRARSCLAAAATLTALAGCGTTVDQTAAVRAGDGLTASGGTIGTAQPGSALAGAGAAGATAGAAAVAVPAGASYAGATAGSAAAAGAVAPSAAGNAAEQQMLGVTGKAFYVGITYQTNGDAANAALGAAALTQGDTRADAKAVVDDINAHGGIAGRTLVPIWHAYDANSQETRQAQDQSACADFTQDHHVAAVIGVGLSDVWNACFTRARILDIDSGVLIDPDNVMFRQNPYYIEAGTISQDRMDAEFVRSLVRMHYFGGWNTTSGTAAPGTPVKVGVLSIDVPEWERPLEHVFLPGLRAAGYTVAPSDVRRIHNPNSTAEDSETLAEIQNAALQFRADGVTHVVLLDTSGSFLIFFGKYAKSQHYYPRLGLDSGSGPQAIYDAKLVDSDQLRGAVGLSWNPALDLSPSAAATHATPATSYCMKVMKQRTGQTYSSTNAAALALSYCDQLYLLVRTADRAGPVLDTARLVHALEGIGSGFVPAGLPAAFFGPGRHDAVEIGWDMAWDTGCTCIRYVGGARRIP